MTNKYNNGKIYIIKSPNTDKVYIGCTINSLNARMTKHKGSHNNCASIEIIQAGGAYIELLENYSCNTRTELFNRERYYIITNNKCCNIRDNDNNNNYIINKNIHYKKHHYKHILSKYKFKIINDNSDTEED